MTAPTDPIGVTENGPASASPIDGVLAEATVLVMSGPGGVGKTTLGAALGLRAARAHGRRVVVVTVDPARRLAEALGVSRLTDEPVLVPVGSEAGRLWVLMVDMASSWDELVKRHAPNDRVAERLLANGLYRTLTRRFVQSHDYIALDHLVTLADRDRYDLVVVDTPPARHALDLLDAPGRMIEFFESRLLRWLVAGAGPGITGVAAKPFLMVAERLLGRTFLGQITEFFTLFAKLRPAFVSRARAVERRLADPTTRYAVVTTTEPLVVDDAQELIDELTGRELEPGLVLVNRFPPTLEIAPGSTGPGPGTLRPALSAPLLDGITNRSLRAAVDGLVARSASARLPTAPDGCPVVPVAWSAEDLTDLDGLDRLLGGPAPG